MCCRPVAPLLRAKLLMLRVLRVFHPSPHRRMRAATQMQAGQQNTDALHLVCATHCNRRNPRNINNLGRNRGATGVQRSRAPISTSIFHKAEEKGGELKGAGPAPAGRRRYAGQQITMESGPYLVRHRTGWAPPMGPPAARRGAGNSAPGRTPVAGLQKSPNGGPKSGVSAWL